jgi:outer membrane receptor protein involved in Fe transport
MRGEAHGAELGVTFNYFKPWRVRAAYSYLNVNLNQDWRQVDDDTWFEKASPKNIFHVRSYWDVRDDLELNAAYYWYDSCDSVSQEAYDRLDVGITYRPLKNLDIEIWGQNLIDTDHREYVPQGQGETGASAAERGVFGKIRYRF